MRCDSGHELSVTRVTRDLFPQDSSSLGVRASLRKALEVRWLILQNVSNGYALVLARLAFRKSGSGWQNQASVEPKKFYTVVLVEKEKDDNQTPYCSILLFLHLDSTSIFKSSTEARVCP